MVDGFCHASSDEPGCSADVIDAGDNIDAADDIVDAAPPDAAAIDAGPPREPNAVGEIIISEIHNQPANSADPFDGEWFELQNMTNDTLILDGINITGDFAGEDFFINEPLTVEPHGRVILGGSKDMQTNGGIAVDFAWPEAFLLFNSGFDVITVTCNCIPGVVLDEVEWDDVNFPNFSDGRSMSLSRDHFDASENDVGANWCAGATPYGDGDLGTPGELNPVCP